MTSTTSISSWNARASRSTTSRARKPSATIVVPMRLPARCRALQWSASAASHCSSEIRFVCSRNSPNRTGSSVAELGRGIVHTGAYCGGHYSVGYEVCLPKSILWRKPADRPAQARRRSAARRSFARTRCGCRATSRTRVRAGHPWVYREALGPRPIAPEPGTSIDLVDPDGEFVGARPLRRRQRDRACACSSGTRTSRSTASSSASACARRSRCASACVDLEQARLRAARSTPSPTACRASSSSATATTSSRSSTSAAVARPARRPLRRARSPSSRRRRSTSSAATARSAARRRARRRAELVRGSAAPVELEVDEDDLKFVVDVTAPLSTGPVRRSARRPPRRAPVGERPPRAESVLVHRRDLGLRAGRRRDRGRARSTSPRRRTRARAATSRRRASIPRSPSTSSATCSRCSRGSSSAAARSTWSSSIRRRSRARPRAAASRGARCATTPS